MLPACESAQKTKTTLLPARAHRFGPTVGYKSGRQVSIMLNQVETIGYRFGIVMVLFNDGVLSCQ